MFQALAIFNITKKSSKNSGHIAIFSYAMILADWDKKFAVSPLITFYIYMVHVCTHVISPYLLCSISDRSYLRLTEQEFTSLPIDIIIQGVFSLILSMYAILFIAGEFREIRANIDLQEK